MDYRKHIISELTQLITYHKNEIQTYLHTVDSDYVADRVANDSFSIENHFWNQSEAFARKIKLMAITLLDYEIVGMCEALIQIAKEIESVEAELYQSQEDAWVSEYKFNLEEYLQRKTYFSASDIGCHFGETPHVINKWLIETGYQLRTDEGLIPTEMGKRFMMKVVYTPTGKKTCRWDKAIIYALSISTGQEILQSFI
ncbi:Uncharacterised protein [Serratia quinivorans]|uniref:hypothetical protein n=1 Tax=Serratia TaxID=613 RepID=UPI00217A5ED8|nr:MULTISPECIES: hypothetical protein [Serratia]CAI0833551.1 Uncharacterised protein [Serratia quinivorans]CAI1030414.1 Uncharacterised protein [Serratia quinivorans]CAI1037307.1 Uncharacterised protein [Serratia quinivorans]CAI1052300.1 Uncharacterised protein [Serratia quinivorans]CAI1127635.1 Uncharacterised protein [Serratia entomophila]